MQSSPLDRRITVTVGHVVFCVLSAACLLTLGAMIGHSATFATETSLAESAMSKLAECERGRGASAVVWPHQINRKEHL